MKVFYSLLFSFLLSVPLANAQVSTEQQLEKLAWLEGKWERQNTRQGRTAFELWTKNSDRFVGKGITMSGTDTVFVERLSIKKKDGELYYVAEVSQNAEPTYFKITQFTKAGFICENPDHDFPKKIEYKLESDGTMKAIISGDSRSIPFVFQKARE